MYRCWIKLNGELMIIQRRITVDYLTDHVWRDVKHELEYDKAMEYLQEYQRYDNYHTYRLIDVIWD